MDLHRRSLRIVALAVVVALPLLGTSGIASAKAKGCHKTHSCRSGGGTGSGTGGATPLITVQVDPNPLVETGQSEIYAVIQVETSPSFAGDSVDISSSQLAAACQPSPNDFLSGFAGGGLDPFAGTFALDDDGNATAVFYGLDCAPGPSVIEASLTSAPYYTALATLNVEPPVVTTPGVYGYPQTSGTVTGGEVETGDTGSILDGSYVYGVFYIETSPVYAEQTVEISSPELQDRCGMFWVFNNVIGNASLGEGSTFGSTNTTATATLDDDGNAAFYFEGASCAAGSSVVTADVENGSHPTYTTIFNIVAPQPTI